MSIIIHSCQGQRIHASIHHDDVQKFSPLLHLHETYYIRGYDLCRSIFIPTDKAFHYDLLFQSTTTLHQCPSSTIPMFSFLPTDFSVIKSLLGYDTYVIGKSYGTTFHKLPFHYIVINDIHQIISFWQI